MGRNAHKNTWTVAQLPFQADPQNRRFPECGKPFFVLADVSDTSGYKNDVRGVFLKKALSGDTVDFYVEFNGVQLTPLGSPVYFPNDPLVSGFVVDWRQHLAVTGPGCYRIKVEANLAGLAVDYYEGSYNVQPWSIDRAMGTVRLYSKFDSYNREKDVNFKDSGFIDSIRFNGFFGKMQPNTEVNNLIGVNRELRKVTRRNDKTYELQSDPLNICHTKRIIDDHLIDENLILVCDHNAQNHSYEYRDLACIVDEVGEVGYNEGRNAVINATFKDKYALNKAMFVNGMMNGITPSPPPPSCVPGTAVNSDNTYSLSVPSGGTANLPDTVINITDQLGNPLDTITFPVYTPVNIDIDSYCPPAVTRSTAKLMKTGQTTSYRTGDDGDIEAGRATDFLTLAEVPVHNDGSPTINTTTNRFTDELGGATYTNNIVIDWSTFDGSTVLGYYLGDGTFRTWNDFIDWGVALNVGAFTTGWRGININEMLNLWQYETNRAANYTPFNGGFFPINIATVARYFWTSTTIQTNTANAIRVDLASWAIQPQSKTNANQCLATRDFTVTGTTLT